MADTRDLTGLRFGRQTVLRFSRTAYGPCGGRQRFYWRVRCDCGAERDVIGATMISGKSRMCMPCSRLNRRSPDPKQDRPGYSVWAAMIFRCNNPNSIGWKNYGGRGISVCSRWRNSFDAFWQDMGSTYAKGLTIERLDNDGDYEPGNCAWVTRKVQAYNRRNNHHVDTPWGRMTLTEAAARVGVKPMTLHSRMKRIGDTAIVFSVGKLPRRGRYSKGAAHAKHEGSHGL